MCRVRIRHHGVFEFADSRLVSIAPIKEYDFVAAFFYQFMYFLGLQMLAAANDTVLINLKFVCGAERDYFRTDFDTKARKVVTVAVAPLKHDIFESRVLLRR